MDFDDYADVPKTCECGAYTVKANVRAVQFRVDGTDGRFSDNYKDLCRNCRKKPQYRRRFWLV